MLTPSNSKRAEYVSCRRGHTCRLFHLFLFAYTGKVKEGEELYVNLTNDEQFDCPANFKPVFLDEALGSLNETAKAQAESICGNDINCLFDIAATGNTAIGAETLQQESQFENDVAQQGLSVCPYFCYLSVRLPDSLLLSVC